MSGERNLKARNDVLIVGAGPVGLLLANYLGAQGLDVTILERLPQLIDYPRGVGMDDETLRAIQSAGLVERVLPHINPHQVMHFTNAKGRIFASLDPHTDEFGWPRRNGFIQPLVDRVLANGLRRFPNVRLVFDANVHELTETFSGVTASVTLADGEKIEISARYVIACDGGASATRKALGIGFKGATDSNRWVVVDIDNDPLGTPGSYLHCTPPRPYVSIALPHGLRRFEFMLKDGEAPGDIVGAPELRAMLAKVVSNPDELDIIRARVYTHNARLADSFRKGRIILAGDAAHIMPVWQGQGYNTGIRDAANLGWKLALVLKDQADDALLDSYQAERRDHAKAMIDLLETVGKIFSPTNPVVVKLRDTLTWALGAIPSVKRYFMEMRFKPMPRYREGALVYPRGFEDASPVGRMFPQPEVNTADCEQKLDDVIGPNFALIAWGTDPERWLTPAAKAIVAQLGIRLIRAVPETQFAHELSMCPDHVLIGDTGGKLQKWFDGRSESVVLLRPDRFVGATCTPQQIGETIEKFAAALHLREQPAQAQKPQAKAVRAPAKADRAVKQVAR
ncbi:MAG: bifunctional 3-(3-hydroxy-phenyl)propionate/3-hydroxycinnamic acid hydroxylase [Sphingomonadales bacterium]|nr:MAG: bifunctional 3-(3-hydroxy-phenyl)propionate/3-hydroxycinnamic acid hydroxylase [Sphingomonadales bacterium]